LTNTLAYYNTARITAVKSFIAQAPGYYKNSLITAVKSFITLVQLSKAKVIHGLVQSGNRKKSSLSSGFNHSQTILPEVKTFTERANALSPKTSGKPGNTH
jgi:hypothetical protein